MRVAFLTFTFPRTGQDPQGHFIARIAEGVSARGVKVTVHAPHEVSARDGEMLRDIAVERFRYAPDKMERVAYGSGIVSNMRRDPRALLAFPGFILAARNAARRAARDVDLLHVHWAQTAYVSGAGSIGPPMVLTVHGSDAELGRMPLFHATVSRPARQAAAVVAVSSDLARQLQPFMPPGTEPRIIGGGVDSALLDRERVVRASKGGVVRLLMVARLVEEKGVFDLCEALIRIREGFHLTVVGIGPARSAMLARFERAGLSDAVEFLGAVHHDDVLEMMRTADIVVAPSHREGFGLVSIEAAAVGTPIVVTRTGAMPEVAVCPESLVDPGDIPGLERALRTMIADAELRERCAAAARQRVRGEFTWDDICDKYVALYEEVLSNRTSR